MQNGTQEQIKGIKKKKGKKKTTACQLVPVFSVFLVNAASLFILAQTWVKSQTVRHDDT